MTETIINIKPYQGGKSFDSESGFQVFTDKQIITLAINDVQDCCEWWGYFLTEDDTSKFIGAKLLGVEITDTDRTTRPYVPVHWGGHSLAELDDSEVMFVDIQTDRGTLQFVAYNEHNGYYGHPARVSSNQLMYETVL